MARRTTPAPASTSSTSAESAEISLRTWRRWRHARAQKAKWEDIEKRARASLEEEIGSKPVATVNGVPVISWKETTKPRKFNAERFREDHPDLYEEYKDYTKAPRPFNELEFDPELVEEDEDA
jgi:hypothetical protein